MAHGSNEGLVEDTVAFGGGGPQPMLDLASGLLSDRDQ